MKYNGGLRVGSLQGDLAWCAGVIYQACSKERLVWADSTGDVYVGNLPMPSVPDDWSIGIYSIRARHSDIEDDLRHAQRERRVDWMVDVPPDSPIAV